MHESDNSLMFFCSRNAQVIFVEKLQLKIILFSNYNHGYLIYTWSDKAFKDTVVSRTFPSSQGEILENAPVQSFYSKNSKMFVKKWFYRWKEEERKDETCLLN